MFDVQALRKDFPILHQTLHDKPLIYLDNAATTQVPRVVLDRLHDYYAFEHGAVHRGSHTLSERANKVYEGIRETVRAFINARTTDEIVFTAGATASINLVADSFGQAFVGTGDEIIVSEREHHSNLLPWQALCERRGASLITLPVDAAGDLRIDLLDSLITHRTRLVAVTAVSNVLGTRTPLDDIIACAHAADIPVLVDATQEAPHLPVDVQACGCDFLVFSGHKMYAGTGAGVLYGKEQWLADMPPYQTGGGMVDTVALDKMVPSGLPHKFEAGTVNAAGVAALGAAIAFLDGIGFDTIRKHEEQLTRYAVERIGALDTVHLFGTGPSRCGALSFTLDGAHHSDIGLILDKLGIAVRTGRHCAEPLITKLNVNGTVRASFAVYNTLDEVDALAEGIERARALLCRPRGSLVQKAGS